MPHIFVSYSRRDLEIVDQLVAHLNQTRVPVWIDRLGIRSGDQWRRQIVEAVEDCDAFLLVLSSNATDSKNIRKEVDLAEHYQKRIIPIVLEEIEIPDELEYQLVGIQRLDLTPPIDEKYPQLDAVLREFQQTSPVNVQGFNVEGVEAYKTEPSNDLTTEKEEEPIDDSERLSEIFRLEAEIEAAIREENWEGAQEFLHELPKLGPEGQDGAKKWWSQLTQAQHAARKTQDVAPPREIQLHKPKAIGKPGRLRIWLYGGGIALVLLIGIVVAGWFNKNRQESISATNTAIAIADRNSLMTQTAQAFATESQMAKQTVQAIAAMNRSMTQTAQAFATDRAIKTAQAFAEQEPFPPSEGAILALGDRWPMVFSDTFDEKGRGWTEDQVSNDYAEISITIGGKFVWSATAYHSFIWRDTPNIPATDDCYLSVDAKRVSGKEDAQYGLVFRIDNSADNFYYFEVRENPKSFAVWLFYNGDWVEIIRSMPAPMIILGGINRLEVIAEGNQFQFFINGKFVGNARDNRLKTGYIGLIIGLSQAEDKAVYEFDNFIVRVPDSG